MKSIPLFAVGLIILIIVIYKVVFVGIPGSWAGGFIFIGIELLGGLLLCFGLGEK